MATLNRRVGWTMPALVGAATPVEVDEVFSEAFGDEPGVLDVSDLTVKEIEEKVESGVLKAEDVYAAEVAGKNRKSVLEAYAPVKDEDDEGTTA